LSTWFEFAPADSAGFEELVQRLRATEERAYVDGRSIYALPARHTLTRAIAQEALVGEGAAVVP